MLNLLKYFDRKRNTKHHVFAYTGYNNPEWSSNDYDSIMLNGFLGNVVAYRSITLLSRSIASIPVKFLAEDAKVDAKLSKFNTRPNKFQGKFAFLEGLINYLLAFGNSYIHMKDMESLFCLRPDRVSIIPNKSHNDVVGYKYSVDGQSFSIPSEDMLHFRLFNPLNDWYGFSPLEVAMQSVDQYNAVSKHNLALLQNGGRPSGCLVLKNSLEYANEEQIEALRESIRKAYSGALNAGKIMVLEGDFEWKEIGLSPKDLDFNQGKILTAREIAEAYGVPPMLVGVPGDTSFSNYKEARLHLWEDTIIPLTEYLKTELENWLSRKFKSQIKVKFDLDSVYALTEKRETLWNKISNADFLTIDEKRKILGFAPLKDSEQNINN